MIMIVSSVFVPIMGIIFIGTNNVKAEHSVDGNTVALWHFDEGSGQYANDTSGNDNNCTLGSTTGNDIYDPVWVDGKFGKALEFDGVDDRCYAPNDASLSGMNELTLEAWVFPKNASGKYIIYKCVYVITNKC